MYHAKESGRNNFQFFKADMNVRLWSGNLSKAASAVLSSDKSSCCTISRR